LWIPVFVFLAGVACIIAAAATGEAEVQLFIIFPIISGSSLLFIVGVLLIVASFVLGFILAATTITEMEPVQPLPPKDTVRAGQTTEGPRRNTRYGGVVLIGPIPIIFGSDRKMAWTMLALAIILIVVVLALAFVNL